MTYADRLKMLRKDRGLTQKQVADALKITEVSYQRYEYGSVRPRIEMLIALADYFDVSLDYLVGRSNVPERR